MTIKTRKPSGVIPWPLVLIEGPEKSGKSWACAAFSASEKVGQTYWLDFAEGTADEYGAVPGARYLLVDHDGTWQDIIAQVEEIRIEAERVAKAKAPPVVLVVDSMTNEWVAMSEWANMRAKKTDTNRRKLAQNPDAEINVSMNFWNDATARHRRLMTLLLTFPGIVVMTARGKVVAEVGDDGKPTGDKTYKVEGHKTLAYDASVWVRMSRDSAPVVIGARSVHHGVRPGVDDPVPAPNFSVDWLVFDALGCDPSVAEARDVKSVDGGELTAEEMGVDPNGQDNARPNTNTTAAAQRLAERQAVKAQVVKVGKTVGFEDGESLDADFQRRYGKSSKDATTADLTKYLGVLEDVAGSTTNQAAAVADVENS